MHFTDYPLNWKLCKVFSCDKEEQASSNLRCMTYKAALVNMKTALHKTLPGESLGIVATKRIQRTKESQTFCIFYNCLKFINEYSQLQSQDFCLRVYKTHVLWDNVLNLKNLHKDSALKMGYEWQPPLGPVTCQYQPEVGAVTCISLTIKIIVLLTQSVLYLLLSIWFWNSKHLNTRYQDRHHEVNINAFCLQCPVTRPVARSDSREAKIGGAGSPTCDIIHVAVFQHKKKILRGEIF